MDWADPKGDYIKAIQDAYDDYQKATKPWKFVYLPPELYDSIVGTEEAQQLTDLYDIEFIKSQYVPLGKAFIAKDIEL